MRDQFDDPEVGSARSTSATPDTDEIRAERQERYGDFYQSHAGVATIWRVLLARRWGIPLAAAPEIDADLVALMMAALKVFRAAGPGGKGDHDTHLDARAYISIAEDCVQRERDTEFENAISAREVEYAQQTAGVPGSGWELHDKPQAGYETPCGNVSPTGLTCNAPEGHDGKHATYIHGLLAEWKTQVPPTKDPLSQYVGPVDYTPQISGNKVINTTGVETGRFAVTRPHTWQSCADEACVLEDGHQGMHQDKGGSAWKNEQRPHAEPEICSHISPAYDTRCLMNKGHHGPHRFPDPIADQPNVDKRIAPGA
jgi:hypothetical protein